MAGDLASGMAGGSGSGSAWWGNGSSGNGSAPEVPGRAIGIVIVVEPLSRRRTAATSASARPAGSPTNSRNASAMPPAVVRSTLPRAWEPGAAAYGLRTASQRASSTRGTPARTWRGRSTRPWVCGAVRTAEGATPGQVPVSAA